MAERLRLQLNDRRSLRPVADGIDFLGYITRPDYLLVRRRVVSALRERLDRTEQTLLRLGLTEQADGRTIFPWSWPLLEQLRQWLSSYLAHFYFGRASSYRLIQGLRTRYAWLDEYVVWQGSTVAFRCPVPRQALRLAQQQAWFASHLPGHVLLIRQGGFWEIMIDPAVITPDSKTCLTTLLAWPRRFPQRRLSALRALLWQTGLPVAWIIETGRRLGPVAERAIRWRWSGAGATLIENQAQLK